MRGRTLPTERDLQEARRLRRKAGSREEYLRWGEEGPAKRSKRGRRRNEFFRDFSVSEGPAGTGLYVVRFKMGDDATTFVLIVRPKPNRVKPGGPIRTPIEAVPKWGDYLTPHEAIRAIVERKKYEEPGAALSATADNITRRLIGELRKAGLAV